MNNNLENNSLPLNVVIKRFNPSENSNPELSNMGVGRYCGAGINPDGNIYLFYGLFLNNEEMIGFVRYEIVENLPIISLDRIEVDPNFQRMGYGKELLARSLEDLVNLFDYIRSVRVLSSSKAIDFYRHVGFIPYYENCGNLLKLANNIFIKHLF